MAFSISLSQPLPLRLALHLHLHLRLLSVPLPLVLVSLISRAQARPMPLLLQSSADSDPVSTIADIFTLIGILAFVILLAGQVCCLIVSLTGFSCGPLLGCFSCCGPRGPSSDDLERQEENQAYLQLDSDEQELYFQSKDYFAAHPYIRGDLSHDQLVTLSEKGVLAYEFQKDPMLSSNDLIIVAKTELNFFKPLECCAVTNLPMPSHNEVYYFEAKIYSLPHPDDTIILVGLGAKPYPWFRLPGRHQHCLSYDLDGFRRHRQPFKFDAPPPFPKMMEGDVVGIGYRTHLGTVFFTHNGKKISELRIGGHIKHFTVPHNGQLFPMIGANNLCSVHVNLGQRGFVWIEANVKKYGYGPIEGTGPAPPAYNKFNADILLECAENDDDETDTSERENEFPPDFWQVHRELAPAKTAHGREIGSAFPSQEPHSDHDKFSYNAYSEVGSSDERITLASIAPPNRPPSYSSGDDAPDLSSALPPVDPDESFASALSGILGDEPIPESDNVSTSTILETNRDGS